VSYHTYEAIDGKDMKNSTTQKGRNMAHKLDGKVALITGASSGIGASTALALTAEGAHVALAARRNNRLEALVRRIEKAGGQAMLIIADVADEAHAHDMVLTANARWGHLALAVNNAGLMLLGPIDGANTDTGGAW
jgi:NADP-dependent 3-hydroxy acid dehydrogenase YdfG